MDFLRSHRKICSAVAAMMVAILVVYSYGSFRSYAASPEVSTLPADIDIDVTYDADTVTFTYNNVTHSIDRNTRYEYINSSTSDPKFLERTSTGYYIPASYWFSPSENRLYVFSGCTDNSVSSETTLFDFCYILGYVPGTNNATTDIVGNFYLHNNAAGYNSTFMYFIDYNFGYVCNTYKLYSDDGWSKDRNICRWYPDVAKINGEDAYKVLGVSITECYYFPADLICVFSNYEISGFHEFDNSKVNTPSYYFNFQYIFYKEKYGYIFVDSAKRVREIGFPNNVNNPRFFFEDICNSYVYSSTDGVSWTLLTTTSTAYAKYFEVSTGTSWTDYTLVYTNDKNFGTPLVTPDWGDFSDVIEKLPDITDVYDNLLSHKTDKQTTALTGINKFMYNIVSGLTSNIGLGGLYDSIVSSIKGDSYTYTLSEYMLTNLNNDLSVSLVYDYAEIDGEAWEVPRVTLYGYIVHIDKTLNNLLSNFNNLINISDSRLKSIYQNITLSNQYLKRISDNLDSLSIPAASPDYSGRFDKLSVALDKLHNDLIYEEGVTKLPNVPQYLVYIYGVTKDIRTRLDTVISKMPCSVEVDTDSIVTAVSDMQTAVTDKLDSVIAKIPSSSGGGSSFDDSNMVGSIVSLKADISDNFTTLIKLLKNDTDGIENIADLTSFLTTYVVSMGNAAYFTTLLDFADGVKNNVVLINETMVTMVTDSGIFAPIFTLGAGFAVFSGLIRKERMD